MELFKASHQWATRPADERFATLEEMLAATTAYRNSAREAEVKYSDLRVEADGAKNEVLLSGKTGNFARLTNWAFLQLARRVGAPGTWLQTLPATLATQNLNYGLKALSQENPEGMANVLLHENGSLIVRSVMSDIYERIWNNDIVSKLLPLQNHGWRVPPARPAFADQPGTRPATEADVCQLKVGSGLSIEVGDPIAPAGLYASDRDMFVFMINEKARINDGSELGLARGFFVQNNEVGNGSYVVSSFLHRGICGNHIVWGAKNLKEFRIRHVGARAEAKAFHQLQYELVRYSNESATDEEAKIASARRFVLGGNREEVIEKVHSLIDLSLKRLFAAYKIAEENEDTDGAPNTAYGFANGLTRLSQQVTNFAGERNEIDRAAGKVLKIAF